ncbi:MAG: DUF2802 domain-containing protein [Bdellovibrionales bacterium]
MSLWVLLLIVFNVLMVVAIAIVWIRQIRPPKEDPRLSRGLQLLQSKIAVLEDLSDRTDTQVKQLTHILEERGKNLQQKMLKAEETILKIEQSIHKSLSVAEIFQDKIPHEEIRERHQQSKYVTAAKMANQGASVDEILAQVDIPRSEVEFIAKVNRDELTFAPDLLPAWVQEKNESSVQLQKKNELEAKMMDRVFQPSRTDLTALNQAGMHFKQSLSDAKVAERSAIQIAPQKLVKTPDDEMVHASAASSVILSSAPKQEIRKVVFPRIFDTPRPRP